MICEKLPVAVIVGTLLSCTGWNAAFAQAAGTSGPVVGRVYVLHSNAAGECPSLDWHLVVGENNTLNGTVGANNMKTMFRVMGRYSADKTTFRLYGNEIGGTRTAVVDGKIMPDNKLAATIDGLPVGAPCQGKTVHVNSVERTLISGD